MHDSKLILDLCGGTGSWSKPYRDAGYDVLVITLPDHDVTKVDFGNVWITFFGQGGAPDIRVRPEDVHGILAAPPCTMFSLARAGAKTPRDYVGAMRVVEACLRVVWHFRANGILKWWALENPRGYLRQFLGRPGYSFQYFWFGDSLKKPTDLWGYFREPRKKRSPVRPEYPRKGPGSWANHSGGGDPKRAITPPHFARAFFKANP